MKKICLKNGFVFNGEQFVLQDLFMEDERIIAPENLHAEKMIRQDSSGDNDLDVDTYDMNGYRVLPGFIDIHFHGAMGADFCDGTKEALCTLCTYELQHGIVAITPTSMTSDLNSLEGILKTAAAYQKEQNVEKGWKGADILGVHLEGPFLSDSKCGAQNKEWLRKPSMDVYNQLQTAANSMIKIVDVAPELMGVDAFIEEAKKQVVLSLAHSDADYEIAKRGFEAGISHVTHLFNAMNGIHHRNPGPIIAAKEAGAQVELICDGLHIHPAVVRMVFQWFDSSKIILISDSMRACGLPDGEYTLGGSDVVVTGNEARLKENHEVLAGSVTNLYDCFTTAVKKMNVPVAQALNAVTQNPAKCIGVEMDYGSLTPGHYASLIIVDDDYQIRGVIHKGNVIRMEL